MHVPRETRFFGIFLGDPIRKDIATRFQPGHSGVPGAGRRKQLLKRVDEELRDRKISPIEKILELIPTLDNYAQLKAWLEILSYVQAKPKETEVAPVENVMFENISTDELVRLVQGNK